MLSLPGFPQFPPRLHQSARLWHVIGDFIVQFSGRLAERVRSEAGMDRGSQSRRAWQLAYGVEPVPAVVEDLVSFLRKQEQAFAERSGKSGKPRQQALSSLCQALISSNRFIYID